MADYFDPFGALPALVCGGNGDHHHGRHHGIGRGMPNTAIERVVDDIGMERRDLAKQAKDAGSAAVAVTAISVGAAWATIFS